MYVLHNSSTRYFQPFKHQYQSCWATCHLSQKQQSLVLNTVVPNSFYPGLGYQSPPGMKAIPNVPSSYPLSSRTTATFEPQSPRLWERGKSMSPQQIETNFSGNMLLAWFLL